MKSCDGCTLCCELLEIADIVKPSWQKCPYDGGGKCTIYGRHPVGCRRFNCLWLQSEVLGEDLRPDRCGVVFEVDREVKMVIATTRSDNWREGEPAKLITRMLIDGFVVWAIVNKDGAIERNLLLPEGVNQEQALDRARGMWRKTWRYRATPQTSTT